LTDALDLDSQTVQHVPAVSKGRRRRLPLVSCRNLPRHSGRKQQLAIMRDRSHVKAAIAAEVRGKMKLNPSPAIIILISIILLGLIAVPNALMGGPHDRGFLPIYPIIIGISAILVFLSRNRIKPN
jgi:hypothetical protein